jgi:inner membrane protein
MVSDGVHVLVALALVTAFSDARRPEPYLVAALAATFPDLDVYLFPAMSRLGYVHGIAWTHRALTHSLFAGVVVVAALSLLGPWRAAALGFFSHVALDALTGGVRLLAPVASEVYGVSLGWVLLNVLASVSAVAVILARLFSLRGEATADRTRSAEAGAFADRFD